MSLKGEKNYKNKRGIIMRTIGNFFWFIFAGLGLGFSWLFIGLIWCITIVGIPVGVQCFKFAGLAFFPFKKEIVYSSKATSVLLNILWIIFGGFILSVSALFAGVLYCVTIIGIPFGMQCFKLAKLALMPFGATVVEKIS